MHRIFKFGLPGESPCLTSAHRPKVAPLVPCPTLSALATSRRARRSSRASMSLRPTRSSRWMKAFTSFSSISGRLAFSATPRMRSSESPWGFCFLRGCADCTRRRCASSRLRRTSACRWESGRTCAGCDETARSSRRKRHFPGSSPRMPRFSPCGCVTSRSNDGTKRRRSSLPASERPSDLHSTTCRRWRGPRERRRFRGSLASLSAEMRLSCR